MKCALIIPDVHRPFHSKKCWDLILKVAIDLKPDEIIFLGDYLDFYNISMHGPKHPTVLQNLQDEILDGNFGLDQIDQLFPDTKKIFLFGNHETRLERYILLHAPALFGITEISNLLEFSRRPNWELISYGHAQVYKVLGSSLYARHEPYRTYPHLGLKESGISYINGHDHKFMSAWRTDAIGRQIWAGSSGWIGNRKAKPFEFMKGLINWQNGFSIVYADIKDFWPFQIRISESHKCIVNGKEYSI